MLRATMMTAATRPVDGVRTEFVGAIDRRQGAGLIDAALAVQLADASLLAGPGYTAAPRGRDARWYEFASAFPYPSPPPFSMPDGFSAPYNILTDINGRLRVVIAWDASPNQCQANGAECQAIALDGDLDLWVSKFSNGTWQAVCNSASNDSSWELCDIPVSAGEVYKAEVRRYTAVKPGTYIGIAWNTYDPSNE